MSTTFPTAGLWMLATLGTLIVTTGLPVWVLLIGSASAFAMLGLTLGAMDVDVLNAISVRTLGLLEHDLLQALPLYVFIGVLLQRLTVADALFATLARLPGRGAASTALAAMGVGTLVAPMNGSVASTSALLARLVAPRLGRMDAGAATALVSVAATIGVVVPPSLVLILLGDAMLRAHTEASNLKGYALGAQRIINTQDVFHAALMPAACVLLLWLAVAWWQGRRMAPAPTAPATRRQWLVAATSVAAVVLLLTGVFRGTVFAVEGAATAGVALVAATLASRALSREQWQTVLLDTLALSGALLALLVGATTFSLVFRLWGTDRWISELVLGSSLPALPTAALVLTLVALCAWVLDAFEMIFVIIPIVAPPLIILLGDAQQAAVLLLLVLQLSFLIPPMGYAVMMARTRSGLASVAIGPTLRALGPYLGVQCAVTMAVFILPATVHALDSPAPNALESAAPNEQDVEQLMRDMASQGQTADTAPQTESTNPPRP
ncbi:MAG: TRAP transporter large permease subunit [Rhodoferax sp.]